jgi:hypothetical protein
MGRVSILDGHVAHERLDDEVVVINLETGAYYALDGASADCWTLLAQHVPLADAVNALVDRYRADRDAVAVDVDALAAELVREGLAAWDPAATPPADAAALLADTAAPPYLNLSLEKYDDMEELLLLDPIHEVDTAGWPALPAETA